METMTDTLKSAPKKPDSVAAKDACLVHIYPTGVEMGTRYRLADANLILGRDADSAIHLNEATVSRHHARIQAGIDGHYVVDLQSTNGCFVNEKAASTTKLKDGDYLRVGNCIFRYLAGGNVEAEYHEEIYRLTIIDALTGIYNKRFLVEQLERELARSSRHQRPLSLVMFDLDRFKLVNDRLGHLGGDHTLRELAKCVKNTIRKEEIFARYGGEEFAVILGETFKDEAVLVAERLRERVAAYPFEFEGESYQVTISLGVFSTRGEDLLTAEEVIRLADYNLYQAKHLGRNRVMS